MNVVTIDFETTAVAPRPEFPPRPVGVAIKLPGAPARYYGWGHPTNNTASFQDAVHALEEAINTGLPVVAHNTKFDLAVLEERMGIALPPAARLHDTMILAHLSNPYEPSFALKPLADKHLGMPPTERDAVQAWLIENGVVRSTDKQWGAYISMAPGDLVGAYAIGDVDRTEALFHKLYADVEARAMLDAYDRERFLIPVLHANEKHGVRVDLQKLGADHAIYTEAMTKAEEWLRVRLGNPALNLDADFQMAEALRTNGIVTDFALTATGKPSVSKATLTKDKFSDQQVYQAMGYRNRLQTALNTFMGPWLRTARINGRIYTSWRQLGAVTGRQSSTPNFQNVVKRWAGFTHPDFMDVPALPLLRSYILPDEGEVLVAADYAGQEVRVAAHYECGGLQQAYIDDPKLDPHAFVQQTIKKLTGTEYSRDVCKTALFTWFYGGGNATMAERLDCTLLEAKQVRGGMLMALPGIKEMDAELKALARVNEPFRTLGGREYFCEPPKLIDGQIRSWEYKLLNYLIQGSSADMTKAAMLRYSQTRVHGKLLLSIHDELILSVPEEHVVSESAILIEAMENAMILSIPLIAEPKTGPSLAELR